MSTDQAAPAKKRVQTRLPPDVRRRQIVEEATRLISISGFNAVSLVDIAEACGIRGPSVLHYFSSMTELLAAVLAYRDEIDSLGSPSLEEIATPDSVKAFLRKAAVRNLARPQLVRLSVVLGAEAVDPAHPAHSYFVARDESTYPAFEVLLRWKKDPHLSSRELLAFWNGLERQWIMDPTVEFMAVWDNFAARFFVRD